jgi:tRNA G37 N-methylase Trm5
MRRYTGRILRLTAEKPMFLESLASITRKFHPKGTERFLRLFHDPDKVKGIETIASYDGLKIHVNTSSFIEWQIFFKGSYEKDIADLIKKYLPRGGIFVDVGANVGVHTLTAARIASQVIAFEPVPQTVSRLKDNLTLNGFTNVEIRNEVASDLPGTLTLHVLQGANKTASVCDDAKSENTKEIE